MIPHNNYVLEFSYILNHLKTGTSHKIKRKLIRYVLIFHSFANSQSALSLNILCICKSTIQK